MAAIGNSPTQQAFTPAIDYFSGNGSTTAFTLSRPVASVAQVQVTIDNVAQNPSSAYTVSANTITFTSAPLSGTNNIYVYYTSPITQVIAPGQGTVNTTALGNITNIASGNSSLTLQTGASNTTAVTVDTSQNVGIGTTSIANIGSTSKTLEVYGDAGGGFVHMTNSTTGQTASDGFIIGTSIGGSDALLVQRESANMIFRTADTERMRIDSSGNVMVATTSSAGKLNVAGQVTATGGFFKANGAPSLSAAAAGEAMLAPDSGSGAILYGRGTTYDVAICQRSTAVALGVVTGTVNLVAPGVYSQTNPNAANVFVGSGGDLYRSTSSLKYKKNIENSVHGLTDLLNLRSVTYQSNNSDNGEQVFGGFIAEEVHDAGLTEFVQYAEDGSPDALAYGNMVALCVKAIQELKAINDTQAETINALTARIEALENR
jgi:hypothetical protein